MSTTSLKDVNPRHAGAPEKMAGEDGLPLPPYAVYTIGGGQPET